MDDGMELDLDMRAKLLERVPSGFRGGRGRVESRNVLGWAIQLRNAFALVSMADSPYLSSRGTPRSPSSTRDVKSRRIRLIRLSESIPNTFLICSMSFNLM